MSGLDVFSSICTLDSLRQRLAIVSFAVLCGIGVRAFAQPAGCDEGVIRLPDRSGTIQICSAIQAKLPQLQKQLQDATQAIMSQKSQITELTRMVRGMNAVSLQLGIERQTQMLENLARELSRSKRQGEDHLSRSLSRLVDGVDDLQGQILTVGAKQGGQAALSEALRSNIGDSISRLEFGSASRQLDEIDRRLLAIERRVNDVKSDTGQIIKKIDRVEAAIGDIAANFESLRRDAAIIANPTRAEEFYNNAVQYEIRGDMSNARNSYRRYFESGASHFDPIDRYVRLLVASEGRSGAAETLRALNSQRPSAVVEAYLYSLEPPAQAAALLSTLVLKHAAIGPLQALLARQFSLERLGRQSLDDQQRERYALQAFLAAHERGEVLRFFIDQRMASDWIAGAEASLRKLAGIEKLSASLEVSPSGNGWQLTLHASEPVLRVWYRLSSNQPMVDLGQHREIDPDTRQPMARTFASVPRGVDLGAIEFFYDDLSRVRRGPVKLPSELKDPFTATALWQKEVLETTKNDWVSYRPDMPIAYFTHLATNRCAIRGLRWGWGNRLDQTLSLPACDVNRPFEVPKGNSFMVRFDPMAVDARGISLQLAYFNGSISDTQSFNFPAGVLESLRGHATRQEGEKSRLEEERQRYDEVYRLRGFFLGAWDVAFGPAGEAQKPRCAPNVPCDLRLTYGIWRDTEQRLKNMNCLAPFRVADSSRYKYFSEQGRTDGTNQARAQADAKSLSEFVTLACEAALQATKKSGLIR